MIRGEVGVGISIKLGNILKINSYCIVTKMVLFYPYCATLEPYYICYYKIYEDIYLYYR